MGWVVKLDKDDFLGKPSLMLQANGVEKRLVGFEMVDGVMPEEMNQIVGPTGTGLEHHRARDERPAQPNAEQDDRVMLAPG